MKTLPTHRKRLAGFSLVEMAIVILIAGIMMGAGLSLFAVKQDAAKRDVTQKHQEAIKQALISYLGQYKRLPCPAIVNSTATPPYTGLEDRNSTPCTKYSGIVPYQTLGLDRSVALDGWENFIAYVVSPNPIAPLPTATPPYTTAWLYSYSVSSSSTTPNTNTNTFSLAFWPSTSTGGIKVTDGTNPIANPATATGAVVALISYGKNGYGALNVKGTNAQPPTAATYEVQNAASSVATIGVIKHDTTDSPTAVGGPFDDIVMILSANDLTGPLIANGTLQANAQAALSQANDVVIGNIISSRQYNISSCTNPPALPAPQPSSYSSCDSSSGATYSFVSYSLPTSCSPTSTTAPCPIFPPSVLASWGVDYKRVTVTIYVTSPSTNNAYILTAGDGNTKTVSIGELQGILARAAGFN